MRKSYFPCAYDFLNVRSSNFGSLTLVTVVAISVMKEDKKFSIHMHVHGVCK